MKDERHQDLDREQLEVNDSVRTTLLGRVTCAPGYRGQYHSHDFWELVYIFKDVPDKFEMICGDEHSLNSGNSLFLIPPNTEHIFINSGELPAQNIYIGFNYSYTPKRHLKSSFPLVISPDNAYITRSIAMLNEIAKPMSTNDLRNTLNMKRSEIISCVLNVVNWMLDKDDDFEGSGMVRTMLLIDKIKEFIMANLDRHISVDELARQLYLSPNYLGQVFRQHTGMTVKNYHNQMRMDAALKMIISGDKTISEIADDMGFESIAYFSRRFKMSYGMSPSQINEKRNFRLDETE